MPLMLPRVTRYIKVGDTVEITKSQVNDGLYVVKELDTNIVRLDRPMFQATYNLVTKVQYETNIKRKAA